jgi:uncharacterized membrane protein YoaK (UPF0700 family)
MPLSYLRQMTGTARSDRGNRHLARYLAFIAGAVNAGGFLAVHQYTSHMTGIVSAMADNLAAGSILPVLRGFAAFTAFLSGAFVTTLCIRLGRAHSLESQFALPLVLEAALLVAFGIIGREFSGGRVLGTVLLLCFTMGLQNAMIANISGFVIRTTHLTGMVTDIGILLGRLALPAPADPAAPEASELPKLHLLTSLIALFFLGGVIGALGFRHFGFLFTVPLAAILLLLAIMPVLDDILRPGDVSA